MNIDFLKPYWLWLFPILVGFTWYTARTWRFASVFRRRLHTGMRILVCAAMVLAMAAPQISKKSDITATMLAVDRSASVKNIDLSTFLQEVNDARGKKDSVGMVCFGKEAGVEQMPSLEGSLPTKGFLSYVDEGASDISAALKLSGSVLPKGAAKRVVLVSDGEETVSDGLMQAKALAAQGVTIDVLPLAEELGQEVQITDLELPSVIHKNTAYDIAVRIDSNVDTPMELRLYKGNTLIANETVQVSSGESRIVFTDRTETGGGVSYRAEITPQKDTESKNNKYFAYTYIDDVPRVLLIGGEEDSTAWSGLISASQLQEERVSPKAVPVSAERLQGYDCVVMANVSAEDLPDGFLEILEGYVKTLGGGLLVSGGESSYALGGYFNTALEEMLPVNMELKTEGEDPDLAMVMVIDRSGSMSGGSYGVTQLEMAKEAAIRSLDGFKKKDQVGVIAFDDKFTWAVPMTVVQGNQDAIVKQIGSIQVGGGTSILPGLTEAVNTLSKSNAKEKHIILLTDGQAEQGGYEFVLKQMNDKGITLSSVAVGNGADTKLLQRLAEEGLGRYYFTDEFTDLPSIFAKETLLAGKEYLNHRKFYPSQKDASAILSGIISVPMLGGYVGTTAKSRSDIVLVSDREEPILAVWQYGLGRTAAWTPDVGGPWTRDWLSAAEGGSVLRNTLGWLMNIQMSEEMKLTAQSGAKKSTLRLEMPFDESVTGIEGTILNSAGKELKTEFTMTAPGIYAGEMDTAEEGAYVANMAVLKGDKTTYFNTGFALSYPAEYDITRKGGGLALLQQIAALSGGRVLAKGSEVFASQPLWEIHQKDFSPVFMVIGLLLFLLDIALRRFSMLALKFEGMALSLGNEKKQANKRTQASKRKEGFPLNHGEKEILPSPNLEKEKKDIGEKPSVKSTAERLAESRKKRGG